MYAQIGYVNRVPTRDHMVEQSDISDILKCVCIVDIAWGGAEIYELEALTLIKSFNQIFEHYAYTLDTSDDGQRESNDNRTSIGSIYPE